MLVSLHWTERTTAALMALAAEMAACCASHASETLLSLDVGRNLITLLVVLRPDSVPSSSESSRLSAEAQLH